MREFQITVMVQSDINHATAIAPCTRKGMMCVIVHACVCACCVSARESDKAGNMGRDTKDCAGGRFPNRGDFCVQNNTVLI